jgi:hypothetical protein
MRLPGYSPFALAKHPFTHMGRAFGEFNALVFAAGNMKVVFRVLREALTIFL